MKARTCSVKRDRTTHKAITLCFKKIIYIFFIIIQTTTNATHGYAVTASGQVSIYNGSSWGALTSAIAPTFNKVFIDKAASTTTVYICGNAGKLQKSSNAGAAWTDLTQPSVSAVNFTDMNFDNSGSGYLLSDLGAVYSYNAGIFTLLPALNKKYNSLHFTSAATGYAISEDGYLAIYNGTWSQSPSQVVNPGSNKLKSIYMNSESNGVYGTVAGENGELWYISDVNTGTWSSSANAVTPPALYAVNKIDASNAIAVGADGTILKTTDGNNWQAQVIGISKNLYDISLTASAGAAVGEGGTVLTTVNTVNWVLQSNTGTADLKAALFTSASNGTAVGSNCSSVTIAPGGNTTSTLLSSTDGLLAMTKNPGSSQLLAVGQNGKILSYNGSAWSQQNQFNPAVMNDAKLANSSTGFAVGNGGSILTTANGGSTWIAQASGTINNLNAIYVFSTTKAIAVGDAGTVLKTTDGGSSWQTLSGFSATQFNDIHFADNFGIIVGNAGSAYSSSNAGDTWASKTTGTALNLNAVYAVDNTFAFAAGDNGSIFKVTANGATWTLKPQALSTQNLNDVYFKDYVTGYVAGNNGTLLKTVTGGDTWTAQNLNDPNPATTDDYNDITTLNNGSIILSGGNGNVTKLNDQKDLYSSLFYYDKLGRLVVSQNAKQFNPSTSSGQAPRYSYTLYDALGRIEEVGEIAATASIDNQYTSGVLDDVKFATWITGGTRTEITHTYYDKNHFNNLPITPENLRKRVASVTFETVNDNNPNTYNHATHYDYDIHGNVKTLLQDNPNLAGISQQYKRVDYEYDLISGNINQVQYQDGQADAFYHKYEYDADNRITNVYTSKDNVIWEQDAKYFFYDHGVLSRTELGDNKVQGLDYAYTLQGWVKGVNSNNLNSNNDIGQDGETTTTNVNRNLTRDAFGYSINYYNGDYQAIDPNKNLTANSFVASVTAAAYLQTDAPNLFNGNISSIVTSIKDMDPANTVADGTPLPQLTAYRYDQLNRIKQMKAYRDMNLSANAWGDGSTYDASYENTFTYDANGNILTLKRNGVASTALGMDDFTYVYENIANGYIRNTNRLKHVFDAVPSGNYATDRDNHNANNFDYNEIGQLIKDDEKGIAHIEWTMYGKLKSVSRYNGSNKPDLEFNYDANQKLISKTVKPRSGGLQTDPSQWVTTYYVRDAQGNIMADYKQENEAQTQTASFKLKERHIYGSNRIGVDKTEVELIGTPSQDNTFFRTLGKKNFELTTHRNDVATVISDRRIPVDANTDGTIDYWLPEILSTEETYPGGFEMPKRTQEPTLYQFSYNGKMDIQEMDDWTDLGDRNVMKPYNRTPTLDNKAKSFPWNSPYSVSENRLIDGIDLDGNEWTSTKTFDPVTGITTIKNTVTLQIVNATGLDTKSQAIQDLASDTKAEFAKTYTQFDKDTKTQYTAELIVVFAEKEDKPAPFSVTLVTVDQQPNKSYEAGTTATMGNSQNNSFNIAIEVKKLDGTKVDLLTFTGTGAGEHGVARPSIIRSFLHELAHTIGLQHPYEKEAPKKLQQDYKKGKIDDNLMIQDEVNQEKGIPSGNKLENEQLQLGTETIEKQQ